MSFVFVMLMMLWNPTAASVPGTPDPRLLTAQLPNYPLIALTARIEGEVAADFTKDENGDVTSVKIVSGPPMLLKSTEDNIRSWKFSVPPNGDSADRQYKTIFSYRVSKRVLSPGQTPRFTVTLESFRRIEIEADGPGIE
jgi:TonB family protein